MKAARVLCMAALLLARPAIADTNYSDIWWNPLESGWGVTIADHETNIFGVLYTYRTDNKPVWYTIPGGTFSQGRRIFAGDVYATKGPSYTNAVFDPSLVTVSKVGNATFDFAPSGLAAGTALLSYTINGVSQAKQIQRQPFGSAAANWGGDHTDLWFNQAAPGWGLALAQHGNNIFGVWYTYDTDGSPLWFVLPGGTFVGATSFSGDLYRTTGPYFGNSSFNPAQVVVTKAGTASLTFDGATTLASKVMERPLGGQEACPGFGANFVATIGDNAIPTLICRQAFGEAPPTPVAGTCSGTYSVTITVPLCPPGLQTFQFAGNFKTTGVDYNKSGPFAGVAVFGNVPDIASVANTCVAENPQDVVTQFTGSLGTSRIGEADFPVSLIQVRAQFSVGTSGVLGTLTGTYLGTQVLTGQFSCNY